MTGFLTPDETQKFQEITLKTKGIQLTKDQAADQGERLIRLFELMSNVGTCNPVTSSVKNGVII